MYYLHTGFYDFISKPFLNPKDMQTETKPQATVSQEAEQALIIALFDSKTSIEDFKVLIEKVKYIKSVNL